jgi:signal recognition particle receptor subunit beta
MASINYAAREISVKIVYYGPGLSGKTTNLQIIHRKIPPDHKSDMVSLATETDRTLFFDFLPLDLGTIKGFSTKFQLYTVPGQVYYNATRKLVLRGVDGVVFVADSAADKIPENLESFQNLEDNLAEYHYKREETPIIIQYNKRDLPNALSIEELQQQINKYNVPWTEAVANKGIGVFDSLKLMGKIVIDSLNRKYSRLSRGATASVGTSVPVTPPPRAPQPGPAAYPAPRPQEALQQPQQRYQQQNTQFGYGNAPTASYQQQTQTTPQPPRRPPVSQPAIQYPGGHIPMQPFQANQPQNQQPRAPAFQGNTAYSAPAPSAPQTFAAPNGDKYSPTPQQRQQFVPKPVPPEEGVGGGQQQYGFVNFETLPIEPVQSAPPVEPASPSGYQVPLDPGTKNLSDVPASSPTGNSPPSLQPQSSGAPRMEGQPKGNDHTVVYPQKQRPARTQIDERDYSVYDSSQQTSQQPLSSNDAEQIEDTDNSIPERLNAPPGKQQKGFLSKFFNRDDQ